MIVVPETSMPALYTIKTRKKVLASVVLRFIIEPIRGISWKL